MTRLVLKDEPAPWQCPLCERTGQRSTKHHLVPRTRGGTATKRLCRDCHGAIHTVCTNRELAQTFNTVAALQAHPTLGEMFRFIGRQRGIVRLCRPRCGGG